VCVCVCVRVCVCVCVCVCIILNVTPHSITSYLSSLCVFVEKVRAGNLENLCAALDIDANFLAFFWGKLKTHQDSVSGRA